jgi:hypothetical protein
MPAAHHYSGVLTVIRKVFAVVASLNLNLLVEAIFRDRHFQNKDVPKALVESFLRQMPFLQIKDEVVTCIGTRPAKEALSGAELLFLRLLSETKKRQFHSAEIVEYLVRHSDKSSGNIRMRLQTTFLLRSVHKNVGMSVGYGARGGVWSFICEANEISFIESDHELIEEIELPAFEVKLDRRLRATGLVRIPNGVLPNGEYSLRDLETDSFTTIRVMSNSIFGLEDLAKKISCDAIRLYFSEGCFVFTHVPDMRVSSP